MNYVYAAGLIADADAGEEIYAKCIACHSFRVNRTGPLHCGLFGREVGSVQDYTYSNAMQNADFTWNETTLDEFLNSPFKMVPGTSMGFVGISDTQQRHDLIAFLKVQSASELCNIKSQAEQSP